MADQDGRVAIVTGAASGIGRAAAEIMLEEGASVVAVDLDAESLAWTESSERVLAMTGDVTSEHDNLAMVDMAVREFGRLDALVLNAGVAPLGSIDVLPLEEFDRAINVNLRGVVLGVRAGLSALEASGQGAIVVTASVSGLAGDPGMWAYSAAKGGVVNLVRALAVDLGHRGVRVNGVCPGPIRTSMTSIIEQQLPAQYEVMARALPLQRWGEPREVGAVINFLASAQASFVTGALIPVDGGVTASTGQFTLPPRA